MWSLFPRWPWQQVYTVWIWGVSSILLYKEMTHAHDTTRSLSDGKINIYMYNYMYVHYTLKLPNFKWTSLYCGHYINEMKLAPPINWWWPLRVLGIVTEISRYACLNLAINLLQYYMHSQYVQVVIIIHGMWMIHWCHCRHMMHQYCQPLGGWG